MINQFHSLVEEIAGGWNGRRFLVIGDLMLDKYIWGDVQRISPEAPVPVVCAGRRNQNLGGAGNVAMNIARLGAKVSVVGYVGVDDNAATLRQLLAENSIDDSLVACADFPTITKMRIMGGHQQMLRLDEERIAPLGISHTRALIDAALLALSQADAVILSDYAKGVLSPELCAAVIQAARKRAIPIIVDPKHLDFSRYAGATTICPNLHELDAALKWKNGALPTGLESRLDAAQALLDVWQIDFLTITLSEHGIALLRRDGRVVDPARARQVFDVSGAGDTVVAVLALCLATGLAPQTALQAANLAAGIVVGKTGTLPVEKHELLAALTSERTLPSAERVLSRDEILRYVENWKANRERIVFTNGCFDLLHIGHITVLEEARRMGDRLVVAINSDASVQRLKGPGRPIVPEQERAQILAALAAVDAVVLFDEDTPLNLIEVLKPHFLVKGGDYNEQTVVGAIEARAWGGEVRIIPTVEGRSTTAMIARGKIK